MQPLNVALDFLKSLGRNKKLAVADFGCGEADLAQTIEK